MARTAEDLAGQFREVAEKADQLPDSAEVSSLIDQDGKPQRIAIVGTLADTMLGFRKELITDMVLAGHTVYAFCTDFNKETREAVLQMGAVPVSYRMGQLSTDPVSDIFSTLQLYRLFRRYRITLSFCYFSKPSIYGTLAGWLAGVPTRVAKLEGLGRVFTRSPEGDGLKKRFLRKVMAVLFRLSLPKANHLFVLNHGDREDLIRFGVRSPEPRVIGGIGVCLNHYRYSPPVEMPVRFIFLGRLLPEKGIRYFIEAAKTLRPRYPNAEFIVVGAPDRRKTGVTKLELERLVEQGVVRYPGPVKDVVPWLAESSVFVLPSYYREGVPRSTQEALAMGRPVITTDMPGCQETVIEGVNGFLVPAHDQQALQAAMIRLLDQPDLLRPMGLASHRLACEKFDVRQINARILTILNLHPRLPRNVEEPAVVTAEAQSPVSQIKA